MPVSLVLLLIVFGALIAAGIPLLLAGNRGDIGDLAAGHPEPLAADRQHHLLDRAAGRDGGRHRLLAVLPAPQSREERAAGHDTQEALRIAAAHLGAGHRGVRADGHDRPGGAVPHRHRRVLRHRRRHDHGRRRGRARLADLPARAAWRMLGTWTDRGRIPFLGRRRTAAQESRFWGAAGPRRGAAAAGVGRRGRDRADRARGAGAVAAPRGPGHPRRCPPACRWSAA